MKVTAAPGVLLLFVYVSASEHLNLNIFAYALIYYFKKQQYPLFPPPNIGFTPQRRTAFICLDLSTKVIKI